MRLLSKTCCRPFHDLFSTEFYRVFFYSALASTLIDCEWSLPSFTEFFLVKRKQEKKNPKGSDHHGDEDAIHHDAICIHQ